MKKHETVKDERREDNEHNTARVNEEKEMSVKKLKIKRWRWRWDDMSFASHQNVDVFQTNLVS